MNRIKTEIRINRSKDEVWAIVADFGDIKKFNLNLTDSYSTSSNNGGLGATRHCDLAPMGSIEERVIEWQEGEAYTVEIFDGQKVPPFKTSTGRIALRSEGNQTVASFEIIYELKFGVIGTLMNRAGVKAQFTRAAERVLQGLKYYAETGQQPTRAAVKEIAVAAA